VYNKKKKGISMSDQVNSQITDAVASSSDEQAVISSFISTLSTLGVSEESMEDAGHNLIVLISDVDPSLALVDDLAAAMIEFIAEGDDSLAGLESALHAHFEREWYTVWSLIRFLGRFIHFYPKRVKLPVKIVPSIDPLEFMGTSLEVLGIEIETINAHDDGASAIAAAFIATAASISRGFGFDYEESDPTVIDPLEGLDDEDFFASGTDS
jgi:hypothetical protein